MRCSAQNKRLDIYINTLEEILHKLGSESLQPMQLIYPLKLQKPIKRRESNSPPPQSLNTALLSILLSLRE